jgi:hypothetical protein
MVAQILEVVVFKRNPRSMQQVYSKLMLDLIECCGPFNRWNQCFLSTDICTVRWNWGVVGPMGGPERGPKRRGGPVAAAPMVTLWRTRRTLFRRRSLRAPLPTDHVRCCCCCDPHRMRCIMCVVWKCARDGDGAHSARRDGLNFYI